MSQRRPRLSRRALVIGGAALGCVAIPTVGSIGYIAFQSATGGNEISNVGELSLDTLVDIPPLLEPVIDDDGRKRFDLTLQTGETEVLRGKKAATWGANGPFLAPTIRASRGDDVALSVRNELPELTTIQPVIATSIHPIAKPAAMKIAVSFHCSSLAFERLCSAIALASAGSAKLAK